MNFIRRLATTATNTSLQDVVIIGGGPAGLTILSAIKTSPKLKHLKCTLIEGQSLDPIRNFYNDPPENYTNKIVSLTPKSIEFMNNKIGNWEFINQERIKNYDGIIAYDSQDSSSRIEFDIGLIDKDSLATMCEVINIQSSLLQKLETLKQEEEGISEDDLTILDNTKVEKIENPLINEKFLENHDLNQIDPTLEKPNLDWPIIKLNNGNQLQTRLLIGADGYNSPVRKYAQIESRGWQYNRFGVVACIKLQYEDFRSVGWQRFLTTGPLAILPLTEDNATIVWSSTPELSEILMKVNDEIFPHLVTAAMVLEEVDLNYIYSVLAKNPNDFSILQDIEWRLSKFNSRDLDENYPLPVVELIPNTKARFPLKMSHADTYVAPRVALVGDAAHTIHPLAGQGLNMGQSDASALINALEKGIDRGMDIGSTLVLEDYVSNAWPANHALLGICDKLHKVFSTDFYPIVLARGTGMKALNMFDGVKSIMMNMISGR
ncbi:COQ6 [Candida pseudojiufengensis]|uniref:COQ6 n=1 Tax=Candida pseudojiufengensis TaxID=497109 RepID=UPI00222403E9|nr:COQ6 [Candida pseudojiufengensis]KAI5966263.1 COQ6 [Candida pseudojiufengensis]